MIHATEEIALQDQEIELRFFRAGGPGGQNVDTIWPKTRTSPMAGENPLTGNGFGLRISAFSKRGHHPKATLNGRCP